MKPRPQRTTRNFGNSPAASRYGGHARRTTEAAVINPEVVYEDLLPDLVPGSNGFAWACCPFHDDRNPSFCVNVETGWYRCMSTSCAATGSSIVGFVGHLLGYEYAEARRYLEQHYG
jgi:hypothetical protein